MKDLPDEYVYAPWKAPLDVQRTAHCIVGADYPQPIINHQNARLDCVTKLRGVYQTLVYKGKCRTKCFLLWDMLFTLV